MRQNLNPALIELLILLMEEAAEVTKCASKILRSGENFKPFDGDKTNLDLLHEEITDLQLIMDAVRNKTNMPVDAEARLIKLQKLQKWTDYYNENFKDF